MEDRFLKRLRKKARKGLRGWPIATVAFYGPNLSQATKVAVGVTRLESGSGRHPLRPRNCPRDARIHRGASGEIRRDHRWHNWLSSPGRNRLRRRVVSGLQVLARTRSV